MLSFKKNLLKWGRAGGLIGFFLKVKGSSAKENLAAQNKPVNSKHLHCTKLVKRLLNFGVEL